MTIAMLFTAREGLGNIGKESRTGLDGHDPVSVQKYEHPAPADNHQLTVTPASNYCSIELVECNCVGVIICCQKGRSV